MTFCHIIITFPLLGLSAERITTNRDKQILVQCTIQAKAPESRSLYMTEAMPNITTVIAMHQFMYQHKYKNIKYIQRMLNIISIYRTIILSDNCRQTRSISSPNVQNFDVQQTACLLDMTHIHELKENLPYTFLKIGE
jgi:hypothetical protein